MRDTVSAGLGNWTHFIDGLLPQAHLDARIHGQFHEGQPLYIHAYNIEHDIQRVRFALKPTLYIRDQQSAGGILPTLVVSSVYVLLLAKVGII